MKGVLESKQPRGLKKHFGVGAMIAVGVVIVYLLSILVYSESGKSDVSTGLPQVVNGVNVQADLLSMDPSRNQMVMRLTLEPAGTFLNVSELSFAKPLRVTVWGQANGSISRDIPVGQVIGAFESTMYIDGESDAYPFDRYSYSIDDDPRHPGEVLPAPFISIQELDGNGKVLLNDNGSPTVVPIGLWSDPGGLKGWSENWNFSLDGSTLELDLSVKRAGGVLAIVLVILALMVIIAALAITVSAAVARRKRRIEPTMASWLAALLFALIPLRNFLPNAPPIGAWLDIIVFFWVELALMAAMSVFILACIRTSVRSKVSDVAILGSSQQ